MLDNLAKSSLDLARSWIVYLISFNYLEINNSSNKKMAKQANGEECGVSYQTSRRIYENKKKIIPGALKREATPVLAGMKQIFP